MKEKILVVEDDFEISKAIREYLKSKSFTTVWASTGIEGLKEFKENEFDLILIDIMMPEMNGIELLRNIRFTSQVPIIILSAKNREMDKVEGLNIGADDYITKPFSLLELEARINRHLKRKSLDNEKSNKVEYSNGLQLDISNKKAYLNKSQINLTVKEWEILLLLSKNPQKVFSKGEIYKNIWGEIDLEENNTVTVHIKTLREKLNENVKSPNFIQTIWGRGYAFIGEKII